MSLGAVAEAIAQIECRNEKEAYNSLKDLLYRHREQGKRTFSFHTDEHDKRKYWLVYDTIAADTKRKVDRFYGDIYFAYQAAELQREAQYRIEPDDQIHFLELGSYKPDQIAQMCQACAYLRLLNEPNWNDPYGIYRKSEAFEFAAKVLAELKLFGLQVSNGRSLYNKAMQWKKEKHKAVENGRIGNNNHAKCRQNREEMIYRLLDLYASPLKPTFEKVAEIFNNEAQEFGWERLSRQRIQQILSDPAMKKAWFAARHGDQNAKKEMQSKLLGKPLEHADAIWSVDGTTEQFYMEHQGNFVKPLYRVTVSDGYSQCILGEACGETETAAVVIEAIRLAIQFSERLPRRMQYDNGIGRMKKIQDLQQKLSIIGIPSQPYNAQSKFVEPIQGRKEQGVMRFFGNFVGGNAIGTSLNAKANPDHLKALKKGEGLPQSIEGIVLQGLISTIIYNNTLLKKYQQTPLERYQTPHSNRRTANPLNVALAFWEQKERVVEYNTNGLDLTFSNQKIWYNVQNEDGTTDQGFNTKHLGQKFRIRFDPSLETPEKVMLFDIEDKYVATAQTKQAYNRVVGAGEPGEMARIKKELTQRTNFFLEGKEIRKTAREKMQARSIPELDYTLAHKDALNRAGIYEEVRQLGEGIFINPTGKKTRKQLTQQQEVAEFDNIEDSIDSIDSIYEQVSEDYINDLLD